MKCNKENCLANLDGKCCAEKCKGELIRFVSFSKDEILKEDIALAKGALYKMMAKCFDDDFKDGEKNERRTDKQEKSD